MQLTLHQMAGYEEYQCAPDKIGLTELNAALLLAQNATDDEVVAADKLKQLCKAIYLESIGLPWNPPRDVLLRVLQSAPPRMSTRWVKWSRYRKLVDWLEAQRPPASGEQGTWA